MPAESRIASNASGVVGSVSLNSDDASMTIASCIIGLDSRNHDFNGEYADRIANGLTLVTQVCFVKQTGVRHVTECNN
jgi:hypothetical protein